MAKKKKIKLYFKNEDCEIDNLESVIHNTINNDNSEKSKIPKEIGFYWMYQGICFFNNHFGGDGFNKNDVEKIAIQVKKASDISSRLCQEQYVLVKANEEKFYVYINDLGYVFLPKIGTDENEKDIYGKTDDYKKIKGFRLIDDFNSKK